MDSASSPKIVVLPLQVATLTVALALLPRSGSSARILLVPVQSKSHMIEQFVVGEELARRGHDVFATIGSPFPNPK